MLVARTLVALFLLTGIAFAQLQQPSPPHPQSESGAFGEQQRTPQPTPPINSLTPEQITKSIQDGINAAAKERESRHHAPPPDNSGWWFNLFLVVFTGGLVVVGAVQCYLIFWTLKATQVAANAARAAAEHIPIIEGAYVYPNILNIHVADSFEGFAKSDMRTSRLLIDYEFKNFGKSPAIIHRLAAELAHRDPHKTSAAGLAAAPADKAILGAYEATWPKTAKIKDFSRSEWETAKAEKTFLHFYGSVTYSDIFGDTWEFNFDWKYSPSLCRLLPDNQERRKAKKNNSNA